MKYLLIFLTILLAACSDTPYKEKYKDIRIEGVVFIHRGFFVKYTELDNGKARVSTREYGCTVPPFVYIGKVLRVDINRPTVCGMLYSASAP